jgi:hypothetical protein
MTNSIFLSMPQISPRVWEKYWQRVYLLYVIKAGEVRSQLYLAFDLNYITKEEFENFRISNRNIKIVKWFYYHPIKLKQSPSSNFKS